MTGQLLDWELQVAKKKNSILLLEHEINAMYQAFQISKDQYKLCYELIQRIKDENNTSKENN